ncbi:MAG TPA: aldo/keto reductase [Bryobacterales bacterium]|jgi:predicted aldo/keto reductase-like oxidoreductase|nr:aldo/keto reductase [Bryobacterales bacterium]
MADRFSRREFLEKSVLAGAAAAAFGAEAENSSQPMPTRILGKTGVPVSILALGCGSRLLSYGNEDAAIAAVNLALDQGIRYLDTAYGYGRGRSETWIGKVAKVRRKDFFLATKIEPRDGDEAQRILDGTLKRLQTDQVDLIHVHALGDEQDLARAEAKNGVLNVLFKLREQKVTRFVGITSHYDPVVLKTAIERHDIDCVQMALNAARQGMTSGAGKMTLNPAMKTSFEQIALPAARKKNLGILAMKIMGQEELLGAGPHKSDPARLLQYTLSLPVAAAVVGMPKPEYIRQNAAWAKAFQPMPAGEMNEFSRRLAGANKAALDHKFRDHIDC